ncbi:MAG: sigma-70 family RNA polymerase sigma factor [Pirellulales bacterium]
MATKTTQELIASCQGLVRSLAWKIHCKLPRHVDLDDLVSYGQVGLGEAARDYQEGRGHFTTYAYHRVRGAILDGLSKMRWFNQADYHRGKYTEMAEEVLHSDQEAQPEGSGDLEQDVRWLKNVGGALATVYLFCHSKDEQTDGVGAVADDSAASPPALLLKREIHERLHQLVNALPADAAALIRGAYFEGLSLKEAGERIGVSKAWASRLHAKALGQLARSLVELQLVD